MHGFADFVRYHETLNEMFDTPPLTYARVECVCGLISARSVNEIDLA